MSDEGSMKWRCAWCGKPHDKNDPPCESCGHHKFEKAVVPVAPENPDHEPQPIWVCPECGREHQKNSPPCSRCGNTTLEKRTPDYSDLENIGAPSYRDLVEPIHVVALVVALVAGGVLVAGYLGIGPLAGLMGESLDVSNVPGNATEAGGLSLGAVEDEYVQALNERRSGTDFARFERVDRLDEVATFYNQRWVKSVFADGSVPGNDRLQEATKNVCSGGRLLAPFRVFSDTSLDRFDSPRAAARAVLEDGPAKVPQIEGTKLGVDIHAAPDGRLFVTLFVCS